MLTVPLRRLLFGLTLLGAVLMGGFYILRALPWYNQPFPGFVLLRHQTVDVTLFDWWNGAKSGIHPGDRIVEVDGKHPKDTEWIYRYVKAKPVGTLIRYGMERPSLLGPSKGLTVTIPSQTFGMREWLTFPVAVWIVAFLNLVMGALVSLKNPGNSIARAHFWYCLAMFAYFAGFFSGVTDPVLWDAPSLVSQALIGITGINLALHFPRRTVLAGRRSLVMANVWMGMLAASMLVAFISFERTFWLGVTGGIGIGSLGVLAIFANSVWASFSHASSLLDRSRSRVLLVGLSMGLLPAIAVSIGSLLGVASPYFDLSYVAMGAFPVAIAYAILRHQLFDIQIFIRRSTLYAALLTALAGVYLAASSLGSVLLASLLPEGDVLIGFLAAMAVALAFQPLHAGLKNLIDRLFWPKRADPAQMLATFSQDLPVEQHEVAQRLAELVRDGLGAAWVGVRGEGHIEAFAGTPPEAWGEASLVFPSGRGWLWIGEREMPAGDEERERQVLLALLTQADTAMDCARLFEARIHLQVQQETAHVLAEAQDRVLRQVVGEIKQEVHRMAEAVEVCATSPGDGVAVTAIQAGVRRIEGRLDQRTQELLAPREAT